MWHRDLQLPPEQLDLSRTVPRRGKRMLYAINRTAVKWTLLTASISCYVPVVSAHCVFDTLLDHDCLSATTSHGLNRLYARWYTPFGIGIDAAALVLAVDALARCVSGALQC